MGFPTTIRASQLTAAAFVLATAAAAQSPPEAIQNFFTTPNPVPKAPEAQATVRQQIPVARPIRAEDGLPPVISARELSKAIPFARSAKQAPLALPRAAAQD